jgi:hypothetical protein
MKILQSPYSYANGSQLSAQDINRAFRYAATAVKDQAGKRYHETVVSFNIDGMVDTFGDNERRFRFRPKNRVIITRAFFYANLTSSDPVRVLIYDSSDPTDVPAGATTPWLETDGPATAEKKTDNNQSMVMLDPGIDYTILLETSVSGGTFNVADGHIVMHCRTDRFNQSGNEDAPNFSFIDLSENGPAPAYIVNLNLSYLTTEVDKFDYTTNKAPVPVVIECRGIASGSSLNRTTFRIPRYDTGRVTPTNITRVDAYIEYPSTTTTSALVDVRDETGAVLHTVVVPVTASKSGFASIDINESIVRNASDGTSAKQAEDYSIQFTCSSLTLCRRFYAVIWIEN